MLYITQFVLFMVSTVCWRESIVEWKMKDWSEVAKWSDYQDRFPR